MTPLLAVLIPTRGTLFTKTIAALDRELARIQHAKFYTTDLPIPDCRNQLVEQALDSGVPFTHLLMVDDDVIIPVGGVQAMLDKQEPITLIDYPSHYTSGEGKNTGNVAYDNWMPGDDTAGKPIMWAGLGCTLVEVSVFEKLSRPYFRRGGQAFDRLRNGKKVLYGKADGFGGEDFEFYQDCIAQGFTVTQVEGVVAGHAKIMRHVGIVEDGKYIKQHDIHIADKIERPIK
jgi:hypothetical protein